MATVYLLDSVKVATSTTGTGSVTVGAAEPGYLTPAEAGAVDGLVYTWRLDDGDDFEIFRGTYSSSGPTVSRDAVLVSKVSGVVGTSKLNLSGSASLSCVPVAQWMQAPYVQNINDGPLSGFRNKIINGNFDIWQRGTSQTSDGYGSDDRWFNGHFGYTKTHSRQSFTLGQTAVPGNPTYFSRTEITVAGSTANHFCNKRQPIEGVRTLAGKTVTVTFWAKADSNRNIAVELVQNFGTGGTPSSEVTGIGVTTCALTTSWQKFSFTASLPSISGKTLGSNGNDRLDLQFWFGAGSNFNARTNSLGHQVGTFDIARVSLVEGDATAEDDPFSPRHIQQELALCQRYYEIARMVLAKEAYGGSAPGFPVLNQTSWAVEKRVPPTLTLTPESGTGGSVVVMGTTVFRQQDSHSDITHATVGGDAEL